MVIKFESFEGVMNIPSEDFILHRSLMDIPKCFKGGVALSIGFQPNPQSVLSLESVDNAA